MIIGFLHIGAPKHGVCRYGRLLAAEAKRRNDLTVLEQAVILPQTLKPDAALLRTAADQLTAADVVHIQFTEAIWGPDAHRFRNLRTFLRRCRPPVVVTIHDTEPIPYCQGNRSLRKVSRLLQACGTCSGWDGWRYILRALFRPI